MSALLQSILVYLALWHKWQRPEPWAYLKDISLNFLQGTHVQAWILSWADAGQQQIMGIIDFLAYITVQDTKRCLVTGTFQHCISQAKPLPL